MTTKILFNSSHTIIFEAVFIFTKKSRSAEIARGERPKHDMKTDHYIHTAYSHAYTAYAYKKAAYELKKCYPYIPT